MAWTIKITDTARKQLKKIDPEIQQQIQNFIINRIKKSPRSFGKPLKSNFAGLWRYRIRDYRVICNIQDKNFTVLIVRVGHRKKAYGDH